MISFRNVIEVSVSNPITQNNKFDNNDINILEAFNGEVDAINAIGFILLIFANIMLMQLQSELSIGCVSVCVMFGC
jgi:hypothetical protein